MYDAKKLKAMGFMSREGGVHMSRTMMLAELTTLLNSVEIDASPDQYQAAVCEQNCLAKPSGRSRQLTARHLTELYGLDPENPIFAGLRYFWCRDVEARPQLALLTATARDSLLRGAIVEILQQPPGTVITRDWTEKLIETCWPERFSPATRRSTAQNINGTLTKSGHLRGHVKKVRTLLEPTAGAVAYALYLAWLQGGRGELLLQSPYCKLLDCGTDRFLALAASASSRGLMVMRRVDNVIDVDFPALAPVVNSAMSVIQANTAQEEML
tara:strand:- start:8007 stop:8816 length:810 start_codon:yes stop_codon:yes gene_type:complete